MNLFCWHKLLNSLSKVGKSLNHTSWHSQSDPQLKSTTSRNSKDQVEDCDYDSKLRGHSISFKTFFCTGIYDRCRFLKIKYVIAIHHMRWLTDYYNFRFKGSATVAIGIYPTKAWLSQMVNFKNAIWTWGHFRRVICNKIMF